MREQIFCAICQKQKLSRFCDECNKDTANLYKKVIQETMKVVSSFEGNIKRGEVGWGYFPIAYGIILTISVGIIQLLEIVAWFYKIGLIFLSGILFFYLCFFNDYFRNKIIRLFVKSKDHKEKFDKR